MYNIIFHSADMDGFCSGAIVKKFLLEHDIPECEINMIPFNYGDPSPLPLNGPVYMVDISLPEEDMLTLSKNEEFVWCDHHISAIKDSIGKYDFVEGVRKVGDSASLLAWEFFFPDVYVPNIVYWVDRYDVWKKKDETGYDNWEAVMQIQWGMRHALKDPSKNYKDWDKAIKFGLTDGMVDTGIAIYKFIQDQDVITAKRAFDLVFEGLKFCAVNAKGNSEVVKSVVREDHDGIMLFYYDGEAIMWKISMYGNEKNSNDIDLSVIAKKHGGGGHAKSCGFSIDDINKLFIVL